MVYKTRKNILQRSRLGRWYPANREVNVETQVRRNDSGSVSQGVSQLASLSQRSPADLQKRVVRSSDPITSEDNVYIVDNDGNKLHLLVDGERYTGSHKNKNLTSINISGAQLSGGFPMLNWVRCNFTGSNLGSVQCYEGSLERCVFDDSDLSFADLDSAFMRKGSFRRANLDNVTAAGALFGRGDFTDATAKSANLLKASLAKSVLDGANFTNAMLAGASLKKCSWKGTNMNGVVLMKRDEKGRIDLKAQYEKYTVSDLQKHYGVDMDTIITAAWSGDLEIRDNETLDIVTGEIDPRRHHIPVWSWQNFDGWASKDDV